MGNDSSSCKKKLDIDYCTGKGEFVLGDAITLFSLLLVVTLVISWGVFFGMCCCYLIDKKRRRSKTTESETSEAIRDDPIPQDQNNTEMGQNTTYDVLEIAAEGKDIDMGEAMYDTVIDTKKDTSTQAKPINVGISGSTQPATATDSPLPPEVSMLQSSKPVYAVVDKSNKKGKAIPNVTDETLATDESRFCENVTSDSENKNECNVLNDENIEMNQFGNKNDADAVAPSCDVVVTESHQVPNDIYDRLAPEEAPEIPPFNENPINEYDVVNV